MQIYKNFPFNFDIYKKKVTMKLNENQLKTLIYESAKRVINEMGYQDKQKKSQSEEEHEAWLQKKSAAKKKYFAGQKKDDDNGGAIDYRDYKNGKGNFRQVKSGKKIDEIANIKSSCRDLPMKRDSISKDDFMDLVDSTDRQAFGDFMRWLENYNEEAYDEVNEIYSIKPFLNPIKLALENGMYWGDIASEFFDYRPEDDIYESINRIVNSAIKSLYESKGKKKLEKSFKSKEDMTQYRDQYAPNASDMTIDTDGDIYDTEYSDNGLLGSGPYMDYRHHTFADGYDYCGDDDYNDYAGEYNDALYKRLATKGGQMSYDWEHGSPEARNEKEIQRQHDKLEADADERFLHDLDFEEFNDYMRNRWVNGEIDDEMLSKRNPYAVKDKFSPKMGVTPIRDIEIRKQQPWRGDGYVPKSAKLDRKKSMKH